MGNPMKEVQLKITTGNLQGSNPLISFLYLIYLVNVVSVPLPEGNNQKISRVSPTELSFLKSLLASLGNPTKEAQLKITDGIFKGFPHWALFIFNFFGRRGISSTNWSKKPEFCKGLTHVPLFFSPPVHSIIRVRFYSCCKKLRRFLKEVNNEIINTAQTKDGF